MGVTTKHILEMITRPFGYQLVRKNYKSRLETPPVVQDPVLPKTPRIARTKQGTPAYKHGLVYIYCDPIDRELARVIANEKGITMKELIHLFVNNATVNKSKIHADPFVGGRQNFPDEFKDIFGFFDEAEKKIAENKTKGVVNK